MSDAPATTRSSPLDRLLERLSIEPAPYRALVHSYFLMDFRNQQFGKSTATGPKALITPLFWVLGQNLIVGLICSFVLFARVDIEFFTLVGLTASVITVGAAVVVEFNEIVLDANDLAIIGHRPLPARTYAAARVTNLLAYLLLTSCSVGLFPAIVGAGMRDAGWGQFPGYVVAAWIGDFAVAGLVILGYVAIFRHRPTRESQEALAWLQVLLITVLFYGGQLLLRDPEQKIQWLAYDPPEWVAYLPTAWLAGAAVDAAWFASGRAWILAAGAIAVVTIWWVVLSRLSAAYARMQPGRSAWTPVASRPLPTPGELGGAWIGRWTRPGEERAAFWLCWTMFQRDPNLRARCWPALTVPLAMLATGAATGRLTNPLLVPPVESVLTLAAVYVVGSSIPALFHNLRYSDDFHAAWTLATAPLGDGQAFVAGLRKAVLIRFVAPLVGVMFVLFTVLWRDPLAAFLHAGMAWLAAAATACVCSAVQLRRLPFSAPLARGASFGPIAPLTAGTATVGMALAGLHASVARDQRYFAAFVFNALVAAIVVRTVVDLRLRRRLAGGFSA